MKVWVVLGLCIRCDLINSRVLGIPFSIFQLVMLLKDDYFLIIFSITNNAMLDTLIGHKCECAMSYVKYNWMSRDTKRSDDDVATWMTLITFMLIIKYIWMARYTNKSSASSLRITTM